MRTILLVLAVLATVLIATAVAVAFSFAMGLHKKAPKVDFHGSEMTAARDRAKARLTQRLDGLALRVVPFAHRVGGIGRSDECHRGQYNWKIKDRIAVECSVTLHQTFTFSGDFLPQAQRFVAALCRGQPGSNAAAAGLTTYEERVGKTFRNLPDGYTVDDIGRRTVDCAESGERFSIVWMSLPVSTTRGFRLVHLPRPCPDSGADPLCDNHPSTPSD